MLIQPTVFLNIFVSLYAALLKCANCTTQKFKKRCLDLVDEYIRCTLFKKWRIQNNFVAIAMPVLLLKKNYYGT